MGVRVNLVRSHVICMLSGCYEYQESHRQLVYIHKHTTPFGVIKKQIKLKDENRKKENIITVYNNPISTYEHIKWKAF